LNAPKKPGTDLNALKARLAKKDAPAPAAPAPAAAAPAPAAPKAAPPRPGVKKPPPADPGFIPAPGEQAPPPMDIPAPGEQSVPMDIPAPGEQSRPVAQPVAAVAAPAGKKQLQVNPDAAPFGADVGGGFDPNAGVIGGHDVGDVAPRGNKGLVALAAGAALLLGVVVGYLFNQISSKGALVKQGKDKGAVMFEETTKVVNMRTDISTKMLDIAKKIFENPPEAAKALDEINKAAFEQTPNVEALFGWQLSAVHPDGIKKTFQLYNEASGLRTDLGYLTGFVMNNVPSLSLGGPRVLAVMNKDKGAVLVERVEPQCGDPKAPAPCGPGKENDAIGWTVRDVPGANPTFAALGTGENQIQVLLPEGGVYGAVVGSNPEANAKNTAMLLLARVNERLEAMNKAEKRALKALKKYSDDPNIDGPSGELDD
jgi:hypothetical protein